MRRPEAAGRLAMVVDGGSSAINVNGAGCLF
jgi:hypothetical protein